MTDGVDIVSVAESMIGGPVKLTAGSKLGGNNRLYHLLGPGESRYALKTYYNGSDEFHSGLDTEYEALTFLFNSGVRNVPTPVARDKARQCGIYEWIDGTNIVEVNLDDIDRTLSFLRDLHQLRSDGQAGALPLAREACLSAEELLRQLIAKQRQLMKQAAFFGDLARFLRDEFDQIFVAGVQEARRQFRAEGIHFGSSLAKVYQTLSPSDFGFHNALRTGDGNIAFVDFEYFGWDDPVKLVSDFLLHPGMKLTAKTSRHFAEGAAEIYADDSSYKTRLRLLYPLYAIRWSLIVLNEFLPTKWQQRRYAGESVDRMSILSAQLAKARHFIKSVNDVGTFYVS